MTFNSASEIEAYVKANMTSAMKMAQEQIFQIIDRFVKEYYSEFSPDVYERTYQLYRSLVKSDIKLTNNGVECSIYFDHSSLDYYMKKVNGKDIRNKGWSEEKTLTAAAHGSHGGYKSGTAIWDDPMKILATEGYEILKRTLIESGIPVR